MFASEKQCRRALVVRRYRLGHNVIVCAGAADRNIPAPAGDFSH
jgi:hypothetical protein